MEIKIRHFLDPKCQFFLYEKEPYLYVSYQFDYGLMGGERIHGITREDFLTLLNNPEKFREVIYYKYMVDIKEFPVDFPELKVYSQTVRKVEPFIVYEIDGQFFLLIWKGRISEVQIAKEISNNDYLELINDKKLPSQVHNMY